MRLYTHAGGPPMPLPEVIILSDGRPRTKPDTFTEEEIAEAGYAEAPSMPAFDPVTQRCLWIEGAWVVEDLPVPTLQQRVEEAARVAVARVNAEAGQQRAKYITVTTGQEGTYVVKAEEARRFRDLPEGEAATAEAFPYLSAEALCCGTTMEAVAALVLATETAWHQLNALIEGRRRGALVAIEAARQAGDLSGVESVFPVAWPD